MAETGRTTLWPRATRDRRRLGTGSTLLVALLLGGSFRLALMTLPLVEQGQAFVDAAVLTGVLAVFGLRSVPLRWIVLGYAAVGGALMATFGILSDRPGPVSAARVLMWVALTVAALSICPTPSREPTVDGPHVAAGTASPDTLLLAEEGPFPRSSPLALARVGVTGVALVVAVTMLVGPWAAGKASLKPSNGDRPDEWDAGSDNALSFQDRLDMTSRPRLTDAVVMTVRSDLESFWRTATYDRWNGTTWTSTDGDAFRSLGPDGEVVPAADDLAATEGRESTQQFRIEGRFASSLPLAPSAGRVDSRARILQLADGSLVAPDGVGRGASYTVTSRQVRIDERGLAAADGPVPAEVLDRYARPAVTTRRVRDLASQIVADAGATTELAKVRALEDWMGRNLRYSIDAPLTPPGIDVVDDFLFESKVGWCEQIASSLVVMARQVGVPARLAVGFAPGAYDATSRRWVVRERDAHAWAEVWFPGVGWVPFDPTATVPLAGDAAATHTPSGLGFGAVAGAALFVGLVALVAAPMARRLHGWRRRRAGKRSARRLAAERWDVRAEQELEALGRSAGRPREPSETVSGHARELAAVTGRPELAERGAAVDAFRYAPPDDGP